MSRSTVADADARAIRASVERSLRSVAGAVQATSALARSRLLALGACDDRARRELTALAKEIGSAAQAAEELSRLAQDMGAGEAWDIEAGEQLLLLAAATLARIARTIDEVDRVLRDLPGRPDEAAGPAALPASGGSTGDGRPPTKSAALRLAHSAG